MVHLVHEIYHVRGHSWKKIKLNQLRELYIAMMLKTLGLSLVGIFLPVYLYQLGYSFESIALFFAMLYGTRIFTDLIAARLIGYFGPKHIMILSHIFLILSLVMLLTLETIAWPLALIAFTDAIAHGMFFTAYHIEFSKIQSEKHGGHEIGNMFKIAKLASAVGPLIGGLIATITSLQVAIVAAISFILASAVPLALSPEPVRKQQHVTWKGFPWRQTRWDLISNTGLGFDQMTALFVWPLFISAFIFTSDVYLGVGLVTSMGLIISVFAATMYGRIIDSGRGATLLRLGGVATSMVNLLRTTVSTVPGAYILNFFNDASAVAVRMPYTRGMYGAASSYEGYRDAYIGAMLFVSNIARTVFFMVLFGLFVMYDDKSALQLGFVLGATGVWTVQLHNFGALKK